MEPNVSVVDGLLEDKLIARCSYQSLARLIPSIAVLQFKAGETLYRAGDAAENFYLIREGEVGLVTPQGSEVKLLHPRFGEEAATDVATYLTEARALTDVTVWAIPRMTMAPLVTANSFLKTELLLSMSSHLVGEELQSRPTKKAAPKSDAGSIVRLIGWALTLLLPIGFLLWGNRLGLTDHAVFFLAVLSSTVTMWVFSLVDDYIPAIYALLASLLLNLAPGHVILSGFASNGFLMALSTFAISIVLVASGLSYRFMLFLLYRLPNNQFWHHAGLFITGAFLTPIIPTANGRISMVAPFYVDLIESLHFKPKGRASTQLAMSCFAGISLFSAMLLSSKSVNFIVYGLLPAQGKDQFQWLYWLFASLVAGLTVLVVYLAAVWLLMRHQEPPRLDKSRVAAQLQLLGPIKQREWAAIIGIIFFMVGIITESIHRIQASWLGFTILFTMLFFGYLNKKEFRDKVEWPALFYLSGITGIVSVFSHVGLDKALASTLPGLGVYMSSNLGLFIFILFVLISLMRIVVPATATMVILATVFMPLAELSGINPWVVGFMILIFGEVWFFPFQCTYYQQLQEINRKKPLFDEKAFLRVNTIMNFARLGAVYASLPFWKSLGML